MSSLDKNHLHVSSDNISNCFHCGDALPNENVKYVIIRDVQQPMCCNGCKAVAEYILDSGLGDYYLHRKTLPDPNTKTPSLSDIDWQVFDRIIDKNSISTDSTSNADQRDLSNLEREVLLDIQGLHCVSCAWLVQQRLEIMDGVKLVSLDHQSGVAEVSWNAQKHKLSAILKTINALGYLPHLLEHDESGELKEELSNTHAEKSLKRLVVAGLGMMQVMMFAVSLYTGDAYSMDPVYRRFFIWVSMLVTFPVLFYSGMPFLKHAWQSIKARRMHMDIPISIALLLAFTLSVVNSFLGDGEVYFDSVVMFVFFLSVSRFIQEHITRRMVNSRQAFSRMLPILVDVLDTSDKTNQSFKKSVSEITIGDKIAIPLGGVIPADGFLISGDTEMDAACLSGESKPLPLQKGDDVFAGMVNLSKPIQMEVTKDAKQSALSILSQRLRRSQYTSSMHQSFAARYVSFIVFFTLLLASSVFLFWYFKHEWRYGFEIALAILVVSCPCALAIALPSSLASLTKYLHDAGIYVINPHKLLNLSRISSVILDKTGTITDPQPVLTQDDGNDYLAYAQAISRFTQHPKAKFLQRSNVESVSVTNSIFNVTDVEELKGFGVSGVIQDTRYYLGQNSFVTNDAHNNNDAYLYFGDGQNSFLQWSMEDKLRPSAKFLVSKLKQAGMKIILCSGDNEQAVKSIAEQLGGITFYSQQTGQEKFTTLEALQKEGETVLCIGDGVNDAEFLQQADLSVSFTNASELAQANADILIAGLNLQKIDLLMQSAQRLKYIYRQNLAWAISYNIIMLPLAVLGFIQPWIAALGMSISSLFVVVNSLRLSKNKNQPMPIIHREVVRA